MTRSIHADTIEALQSDSLILATLVQLDFDTPIKITDFGRNLSALSSTFLSSPHFIDSGAATETSELRINSLTLTLSAVAQEYVAAFLNNPYIDVRARFWRAVLDDSDAVIGEPILIFDGRISGYSIEDADTDSTISIEISSHWKDFDLTKGRRTNNNSQQIHFPSDKGFQFAPETVKNIKWGGA